MRAAELNGECFLIRGLKRAVSFCAGGESLPNVSPGTCTPAASNAPLRAVYVPD